MRLIFVFSALLLALPASAAEPEPNLLEIAAKQKRTGWIEVGAGIAGVGGSLALLLYKRPAGLLSTEPPASHELRTMSGAALGLASITSMMVGADTLRRARGTREQALAVMPLVSPSGGGLLLTGHF